MQWIRWSGISVFLVIVGIIVGVGMLLVDPVIEYSIENGGGQIVGAQVDVAKVDSDFFQGRVEVVEFQATNPSAPDTNLFSFSRAVFSIDFAGLFARKLLIDELTIEGLKTGDKREVQGEVYDKAKQARTEGDGKGVDTQLPGIELPTVEELLEKFPIQSIEEAKAFEARAKKLAGQLEKDIQKLPKEEKLKEYEARLKALKTDSKDPLKLLAKAKEFKQLRGEIKQDIEKVKQVKSELKGAQEQLKAEAKALKNMPAKDVDTILSKLGLGDADSFNLVGTLFGEKVKDRVEMVAEWIALIAPYLKSSGDPGEEEKSKSDDFIVVESVLEPGRTIEFPNTSKEPSFLVRKLFIERATQEKSRGISGKGEYISSNPKLVAEPAKIQLKGEQLERAQRVELDAEFDYRKEKGTSVVRFNTKAYQLDNLNIADDSNLNLSLEKAKVDLDSDIKIINGEISGNINTTFLDASIKVDTLKKDNEFMSALASTLRDVKRFNLNTRLSGTLQAPKFKFATDLDDQVKATAGGMLKEKAKGLEGKLKRAISEKAGISQDKIDSNLKEISGLNDIFERRENSLKELLSAIK